MSVIYLIDGTYTVFRAYYAIRGLTSPDGLPTNAVFGFVNTVRKLQRDRTPAHLGVAFDLEGPTHRDEKFAEYKANREPPPEDLVPQFDLAMRACEEMKWPILTAEGFEADDVIATLAVQAREAGLDVVIVTSDKDLYQLVGDGIAVLNPSKDDRMLDPAGVEEVFGVRPEQVVAVLALMGDKVDNVPGVPGVGEKTAKVAVRRYGSLDAVLERAEDFAALLEARDEALAAWEKDATEEAEGAMERVRKYAARLREREAAVGDEASVDLEAKFAAAADLDPATQKKRDVVRILKSLDKKTQPKVWRALAEHAEAARFSEELVTVHREAPVSLDLEALTVSTPSPAAPEFFRSMGFRRLTEEVEAEIGEKVEQEQGTAELEVCVLRDRDALEAWVDRAMKAECLAFDTETTSLDTREARLVGISLAYDEAGGAYIPLGHLQPVGLPIPGQLSLDVVREVLSPLFASAEPRKVAQNARFDLDVLRRAGFERIQVSADTLIAAQILEPGRGTSHRLDDLALRHLGRRMIPYAEIAGEGKSEVTLDQVEIDLVARYAVEDAVITLRLLKVLEARLIEDDLLEIFTDMEMPILEILSAMEDAGIGLDVEALASMSTELESEMTLLKSEIHSLAGRDFNINSPQQLREILFDHLGLKPTGRRTKKARAHSTGQESLEALSEQHPLPKKILDFRELSKLKSTYVDALPKLVDPADGRIHTRYHQLGTATGRLSSSDPNLQNIPVRTAMGRKIRKAFVPAKHCRFISADYSQMELRVLAHLSDDEALQQAFLKDLDIHRYTASLVAGIPLDEVDDELRARAKTVNFGIIYGMSEFRLAREQDMTREEARAFIDAYFDRYPGVREYIDAVTKEVQQTGIVRTLYGRIRRFPELLSSDSSSRMVREALLRQAVNATIQGTAADIVKRAMIRVDERLRAEGFATRMLLQVHDELLFEAPLDEIDAVSKVVQETMEGAATLSVPLRVQVGTANNWSDAH